MFLVKRAHVFLKKGYHAVLLNPMAIGACCAFVFTVSFADSLQAQTVISPATNPIENQDSITVAKPPVFTPASGINSNASDAIPRPSAVPSGPTTENLRARLATSAPLLRSQESDAVTIAPIPKNDPTPNRIDFRFQRIPVVVGPIENSFAPKSTQTTSTDRIPETRPASPPKLLESNFSTQVTNPRFRNESASNDSILEVDRKDSQTKNSSSLPSALNRETGLTIPEASVLNEMIKAVPSPSIDVAKPADAPPRSNGLFSTPAASSKPVPSMPVPQGTATPTPMQPSADASTQRDVIPLPPNGNSELARKPRMEPAPSTLLPPLVPRQPPRETTVTTDRVQPNQTNDSRLSKLPSELQVTAPEANLFRAAAPGPIPPTISNVSIASEPKSFTNNLNMPRASVDSPIQRPQNLSTDIKPTQTQQSNPAATQSTQPIATKGSNTIPSAEVPQRQVPPLPSPSREPTRAATPNRELENAKIIQAEPSTTSSLTGNDPLVGPSSLAAPPMTWEKPNPSSTETQGPQFVAAPLAYEPQNALDGQPQPYPGQKAKVSTDNPVPALDQDPNTNNPSANENLPKLVEPYWNEDLRAAIKGKNDRAALVDLESMVWAAMSHSPMVQSILITPMIRETEIKQAQGVFDPTQFVDSIWNDRNDPVGNTLTTGGPPRLEERLLNNKAGIRSRNELGGNLEASQSIDLRNNNSLFFVPKQQADTKMLLRYTQPLMRGAGRLYNRATITIAELNASASGKDANLTLQQHILKLTEAYWRLYLHRAQLVQLQNGIYRLEKLTQQLVNRADLDLVQNQVMRANASINTLLAKRARLLSEIVNDEEQLRRLVNAPWIQFASCDEIIPTTAPFNIRIPVDVNSELETALNFRPDVLSIRDEIQAANVKLRVAEQDLKPTLNLVTDMYVRGLNGSYDLGNSIGDQFSTGRPAYSAGVEYQRPRNQTLSRAIKRQRDLELQQLLFRLSDQLLSVSQDVRSTVAAAEASYSELVASIASALATQAEVEYLESRWESSALLEPNQISLNLEQLLDSQQRWITAESNWSASQAQYMISLAQLRFASGTLLSIESVPNGTAASPPSESLNVETDASTKP